MSRILYILGIILIFFSIIEIFPFISDLISGSDNWVVFLFSSIFTLFVGVSLVLAGSNKAEKLTPRDAFSLTALVWLVIPFMGAIPFLFSIDSIGLVDSTFESISGLTTTGLTIFDDLDNVQPGILLWRSLLQWIGGIGIIVMSIAIFPLLRLGGMHFMTIEPSRGNDKALPRTFELAIAIGIIYFLLTIACLLSYIIFGMNFFDAVNYAMTTISTGGFSVHNKPFEYYDSLYIKFTAIFFMIIGVLPFTLYIKAIRKNILDIFSNSQVRFFLSFCFLVVLVLTFWFWLTTSQSFVQAFIFSSFNAISIITTTGFSSSDIGYWGSAYVFVLILAFSGGCSGSTSGSIKIFRYQLMLKFLKTQLDKLLHPHGVFVVRYENNNISSDIIFSVTSFFTLYLISWALLSSLIALTGSDFQVSISTAAASLTNVGPAVGMNANYQDFSSITKILMSIGMLVGRLELFIFFVFLLPSFWRDA